MEKINLKKIMVLTFMITLVLVSVPKVSAANQMDSRFTDYKFYKCVKNAVLREFGTNGISSDGITIKNSSLQYLKELDCRNYNISNTTGLNLMPNLKYLDVSGNYDSLKSIDVSKNTKLETLYISQGDAETYITSIDLSKNIELKTLGLSFNSKLKSIDLSKNTKLESLNLYGDKLTSIDLRKNTKLKEVRLDYNNLSNINLSKNINLKNLYLSQNNLKSIDLSKNTKLNHLDLSFNKLSNIDLSKNTKLNHLVLDHNNFTSKPTQCVQLGNLCWFGYIVKFQTNGGSTVKTINAQTIRYAPKTTKSGYGFDGWYKKSNFSSSSRVTYPFRPDKDMTLYAKWNKLDYVQEEEETNSPNKTTIIAIIIGVLVVACIFMSSNKPKKTTKKTKTRRTTKPSTARKTSTTRTGTKKKSTSSKKKK